ncbi:MAG: hypothetical protein ACRD0Z_12300 [Acidimicrobiales bacterium]
MFLALCPCRLDCLFGLDQQRDHLVRPPLVPHDDDARHLLDHAHLFLPTGYATIVGGTAEVVLGLTDAAVEAAVCPGVEVQATVAMDSKPIVTAEGSLGDDAQPHSILLTPTPLPRCLFKMTEPALECAPAMTSTPEMRQPSRSPCRLSAWKTESDRRRT